MSDYDFSGAFQAMTALVVVLAILAIFGIWKLVEIAIWIVNHVSIAIK